MHMILELFTTLKCDFVSSQVWGLLSKSKCKETQSYFKSLQPTRTEWENIESIIELLQPFDEITKIMSADMYPTMSKCTPLFNSLFDHLEKLLVHINADGVIVDDAVTDTDEDDGDYDDHEHDTESGEDVNDGDVDSGVDEEDGEDMDGEDGEDGDGEDGDGEDREDREDGEDGEDGETGDDWDSVEDGDVVSGEDGDNGDLGDRAEDGEDGEDGEEQESEDELPRDAKATAVLNRLPQNWSDREKGAFLAREKLLKYYHKLSPSQCIATFFHPKRRLKWFIHHGWTEEQIEQDIYSM
jgi:hypothetical protein